MGIFDSCVRKLETGEQPRAWNFYQIVRNFENFLVINNCTKLYEETRNKNDIDPNLARDFCSTVFLSKPYGYSFFIRAFPYECGSVLGKSMSITLSLIAGPFEVIPSRPFKGTIQTSIFRQDKSG